MVAVDRLSKAAHFGMLPTSFTTNKEEDLFTTMIASYIDTRGVYIGQSHYISKQIIDIYLQTKWD